jgi:hypothetical protein
VFHITSGFTRRIVEEGQEGRTREGKSKGSGREGNGRGRGRRGGEGGGERREDECEGMGLHGGEQEDKEESGKRMQREGWGRGGESFQE